MERRERKMMRNGEEGKEDDGKWRGGKGKALE